MQWCTDTFGKEGKELAKEAGCSVNEYLERAYAKEQETTEEPTGLLVLPHFRWGGDPLWIPAPVERFSG